MRPNGHAICVFYPTWAHEEEGDIQPQNDEAHQYDEDTIIHSFDKIGECKCLKIVHLNIQGLRGSLDELKVALQRTHVDVLTISETKLTDNVDDGK